MGGMITLLMLIILLLAACLYFIIGIALAVERVEQCMECLCEELLTGTRYLDFLYCSGRLSRSKRREVSMRAEAGKPTS